EELVTRRIGAHQLETGDAVWDSWKREDRTWQLKLVFLDGGEERVAHWLYEPRHNTVTPADEEAARFSSPTPAPSPTANVTPFAPRRAEAEVQRPSARSAPERVGGLRRTDGPLDDPLRPSVPRGEEGGPVPRGGERVERREEQAHRWTDEPRGHRGYDAPAARPQQPAPRDTERFETREAERFEPAPEREERPAYREAERGERAPERSVHGEAERATERTHREGERPERREAERAERSAYRDGYAESGRRDEREGHPAPRHEEPAGHGRAEREHGHRNAEREREHGHRDAEREHERGHRDAEPHTPRRDPADAPARPASPVFEEERERYDTTAADPVADQEPARPRVRPAERPRTAPAADERPEQRERPAWSAAADQVPPAAPLSQPAPRRRRATIDLNDTGTPRRAADAAPTAPSAPVPAAAAGGDRPAPKRKGRGRRASVPSWDEIMFGAKKDE
ncbi:MULTISPECIES: septation protein SepH, partial [unclassified Nocardiopsis]